MRICFICFEVFGRGTFGGFGRATRVIARELIARGIEVTIVAPLRGDARKDSRGSRESTCDGIRVLEFPMSAFWSSQDLYRRVDADLYHSQDTSLGTYLAMKVLPDRAHLITFRDPMAWRDWVIEWWYAGPHRLPWLLYPLYVDNFLVNRAVHRTPFLYCAAPFLVPVTRKKYRLCGEPRFLPTPVEVPATVVKATRPTVCFVGRWDRRKRPERFLALARDFPDVSFVSVGGTFDRRRDEALRETYGSISNLEMTGFIDQFATDRLARILERSWVLINTSAREGLPNTFLEAAAHRCAILSQVDHEGFASRFGYHAADGDLRRGLAWLLAEERWRAGGERAYEHARQVYATERAIEAHLSAYHQALGARPGGEILCGDSR